MLLYKFSSRQPDILQISKKLNGGVEGLHDIDANGNDMNDENECNMIVPVDKFDVYPSNPDGHCLLHTLSCCIYHATGTKLTISDLSNRIRSETLRNISELAKLYENYNQLIKEMNNYLDKNLV